MRATLAASIAGVALLAVAAGLGLTLAERAAVKPYDVLHVPSGKSLRFASLGHRTCVSDLYWLSAVQYVGEPRAEQRGWEKLYPLVDLVTDLDPRHGYAYQTAGIVLSAAGRLDESDAILKKGVEQGPPNWTYPYYLAFNAWFYRGDYPTAAHWAEIAARRPGASPNISHLAVALASKSGSPADAIAMLEELRRTVRDEASAARLDEQLKLAILEHDAQSLERAAAAFQSRFGRPIFSLDELVVSGLIPAVPPDPFGGVFTWRADEGRVRSSVNPFRFELRARPSKPRFQYKIPDRAFQREHR